MRWCFLQLGKTYATTKRKLGIPKDLVERPSLSFCCRELICDSEVRATVALVQASLPTRTNQLHVNPRDSISGFLQSRFTNNEQNKCTVPHQWFGQQQRAALPNQLRRCARMHTCNPWPVLEHMAQTHASRLTIFICCSVGHSVARKSRQR